MNEPIIVDDKKKKFNKRNLFLLFLLLVSMVLFMYSFSKRYGIEGYYMGYLRIFFFIVIGLLMIFVFYLLIKSKPLQTINLKQDIKTIGLKCTIIIGTLFLFVMPIYALLTPFTDTLKNHTSCILFILGILSLIALFLFIREYKAIWNKHKLSTGIKNIFLMMFLFFISIGSLFLAGVETQKQIKDIPYIDNPKTIILVDYSFEKQRSAKHFVDTILKGMESNGVKHTFNLGSLNVSKEKEENEIMIVEYLPHTKTVMNAGTIKESN